MFINYTINISKEGLKWRPMLRQMQEISLHQTLLVQVASDTQKIQSSARPKQCWALQSYVVFRLLSEHRTSFQAFCWYVNYKTSKDLPCDILWVSVLKHHSTDFSIASFCIVTLWKNQIKYYNELLSKTYTYCLCNINTQDWIKKVSSGIGLLW